MKLNGIFSYFETQAPTCNEIEYCETTFITPDLIEWDPYSDHFALSEDAMLDWEGNITQKSWIDNTRVNEDHKSDDFESLALDDIIDANIASAYALS